jgi:excisionase family DNA binding protein
MKKKDDEESGDAAIEVVCSERCQAYHTIMQATVLLNVSKKTVYNFMDTGRLQYFHPSFGRRIHHQEIDRYLKEKEKEKAAARIGKNACGFRKRGRPKKVEPIKANAKTAGRGR